MHFDSLPSLQIKPAKTAVQFNLYVRHGHRPTVTEYDRKTKIPDESCSLSPRGHCSEQAYDFLLVDEVLRKPGPYYIGILYDKEAQRIKRRKRRACSRKGRQKRSCVEIKDPPRPENITVKPVYDPKTDVNYSMSIIEEECLFWDSKEERWLSRGCKVTYI